MASQVFPPIHLDDHLANLRPVAGAHAEQYVELAFLDVDLEQVDALDALLRDDAGQGSQLRGHGA